MKEIEDPLKERKPETRRARRANMSLIKKQISKFKKKNKLAENKTVEK